MLPRRLDPAEPREREGLDLALFGAAGQHIPVAVIGEQVQGVQAVPRNPSGEALIVGLDPTVMSPGAIWTEIEPGFPPPKSTTKRKSRCKILIDLEVPLSEDLREVRVKIRGYNPDILRVEEEVENPAMQVRRLRGRNAYAFPNEMLDIHVTTHQRPPPSSL